MLQTIQTIQTIQTQTKSQTSQINPQNFTIRKWSFTFKPYFNENITPYHDLIAYCDTLSFEEDYDKSIYSSFNTEITFLPISLKTIIFNWIFNSNVILPNELEYLTFGYRFNQPIKLPPKLLYVKFGYSFNQNVKLPSTLCSLTLGLEFDSKLSGIGGRALFPSLKFLSIQSNCKQCIEELPDGLEELVCGPLFDLPIDNFPSNLKRVWIQNSKYTHGLEQVPRTIKWLKLGYVVQKR